MARSAPPFLCGRRTHTASLTRRTVTTPSLPTPGPSSGGIWTRSGITGMVSQNNIAVNDSNRNGDFSFSSCATCTGNVAEDGSGNVTWSPSWQSTSWTPTNGSPWNPPPVNYYKPVLRVASPRDGYQGSGRPVVSPATGRNTHFTRTAAPARAAGSHVMSSVSLRVPAPDDPARQTARRVTPATLWPRCRSTTDERRIRRTIPTLPILLIPSIAGCGDSQTTPRVHEAPSIGARVGTAPSRTYDQSRRRSSARP